MTSQPTDDSVPQGDDRGTSPGGRSSPQLTHRGAPRKRRPYRPRRDRGRFRLTPRYEQRLAAYQLRPQGPRPELPALQPQTKSKVLSIVQRWVAHGYALTDQPH